MADYTAYRRARSGRVVNVETGSALDRRLARLDVWERVAEPGPQDDESEGDVPEGD